MTLSSRPNIPSGGAAACIVTFLVIAGSAQATDVWAVRIDGGTVRGTWVGSPDGESIELQTTDGVEAFQIDDLAQVVFGGGAAMPSPSSVKIPSGPPVSQEHSQVEGPRSGKGSKAGEAVPSNLPTPEPEPLTIPALFHLADGGRVYGELIDDPAGQRDAVLTRTVLGEAVAFSFDRLAAVELGVRVYREADRAFDAALAERLPGEDVLITRGPEGVRTLRGRLVELGPLRGTFAYGERARTFRTEKLFGVVFAAGVERGQSERYPITAVLVGGSVLPGNLEAADPTRIRLATSLGPVVDLPLADVVSLRIHSNRIVYVSDLSPYDERIEGLLHRSGPGRTPWPVKRDRSVAGGPLSIAGQTFSKGLGVHSFTELTFDIGGAYETFAATIGIDDAVRPRGHVVFRVIGDEEILFDSGPVTGRNGPKGILVDIVGVQVLKLVVDYGEELDIADHADWGDARLLRPPGNHAGSSRGADAS